MTPFHAMRIGDREAVPGDARPLDLTPLLGMWMNTESRWQWIRSVELREQGGALSVRLTGGAAPAPRESRGEADCVYAAAIHGSEAAGFRATFDHESVRAEVQATLNQGLMVLVAFTDSFDESAGPSRVTREFFARQGGAA